ncbi:MAG: hypothetical protein GX139_12395 [Armatimonadetes bacterium]|nr:hypothetical protein [Armatimonadota bacterium]
MTLRRRCFVFIAAMLVCASVAGADSYKPAEKTPEEFRATGAAVNINRRAEIFDIVDHGDTFTILAERATIDIGKGRYGTVANIKDNAKVRVVGEQLSPRTVMAATVTLLDDADAIYDSSTKSYAPNDQVDTVGYVTGCSPRFDEIDVRTRSGSYVVVVKPGTVIRRYLYSTEAKEIRKDDSIRIVGTVDYSGKIIADRIQISLPTSDERGNYPIGKDYKRSNAAMSTREDVVEGIVTYPVSVFDRTLGIETRYGDRKIDVPKTAEVFIDKRTASVHDLMKGDRIRAVGLWSGRTLVASRVETISDLPSEPASAPSADNDYKPTSPDPAEKQQSESCVGRIIEIDEENYKIIVDSDMTDILIDAQNAAVTRKGSAISFGELKKGDKIEVKGERTNNNLKAASINIVE